MLNVTEKKNKIRKNIKFLCKHLTQKEKALASKKVNTKVLNYLPIKISENIALFFSVKHELNTKILILNLWKNKKKVFLPKITSYKNKELHFVQYEKKSTLKLNKFNIPEPKSTFLFPIKDLDIILVPIIAFDLKGNRLGMGGGFYDNTLKHTDKYKFLSIGLAYDCQRVKKVFTETWDIPISCVITPSKIWTFKSF